MNDQTPKPISFACGIVGQSATWANLQPPEYTALEAALNGSVWFRIRDGRLESVPAYKTPPPPVEDPMIPPRWSLPANDRRPNYDVVDQSDPKRTFHSASLLIQHVCGYGWTKDRYRSEVGKLESWGFECCRSRRGDNGRFWSCGSCRTSAPLRVTCSVRCTVTAGRAARIRSEVDRWTIRTVHAWRMAITSVENSSDHVGRGRWSCETSTTTPADSMPPLRS